MFNQSNEREHSRIWHLHMITLVYVLHVNGANVKEESKARTCVKNYSKVGIYDLWLEISWVNFVADDSSLQWYIKYTKNQWISRPGVLCEKGGLKTFGKFTGKDLCWDWRPATFLKRNSTASVFLWLLRNFKNTIFIEHLWMVAS